MKTNKLITQIFKKWSTKPLQVQDKGLLTICIASYNASKTIANTLSSINLDSNKDVFVYVVDDGEIIGEVSSVGTLDLESFIKTTMILPSFNLTSKNFPMKNYICKN